MVDPGPHGETGVFDGLEAPRPAELLLEGFDEALAKAVLLRRVRCDVFLCQAVAGRCPGSEILSSKAGSRRFDSEVDCRSCLADKIGCGWPLSQQPGQ